MFLEIPLWRLRWNMLEIVVTIEPLKIKHYNRTIKKSSLSSFFSGISLTHGTAYFSPISEIIELEIGRLLNLAQGTSVTSFSN
jgi:hypothetical protein